MSFLIDPPLLYSGARVYRRATRRLEPCAKRDARVAVGGMVLFWGVSIGLYLDQGWTKPVWKLCRAASGRDWMLNSGVFKFDWRSAGPRTHKISAAIFATYPLWMWLGMRRRARDSEPVGASQAA